MINLKKMRKFGFGLLAASTVAMLGACGQSPTDSGDVVTIEYWHVNSDAFGGAAVEWIIDTFNELHNDIQVVGRFNAGMYTGLMSNLTAEVAAGGNPSVVQVGWAMMEYFESTFPFVTPQELIENFASEDDQDWLERNFLPNVLELAESRSGIQLGLPYAISTPVMFINQDLLREAGLPEEGPQTWPEVAEFARQIRETTGRFGLYMQEPNDSWATQALIESNGARVVDYVNGQLMAAFASAEGIEAWELYASLVEDGSALHITWEEGINAFAAGEVGMLFTTIARRAHLQETAEFDITATPAPTWPGNPRRIPAGGALIGVMAQTEAEQRASWEFLRFLYSFEAVAQWVKGTGFMPQIVGVEQEHEGLRNFLAENDMMQASLNQMDSTVNWVAFPGDDGILIEQMMLDMRDRILGGHVGVEEALTTTQDEINAILGN